MSDLLDGVLDQNHTIARALAQQAERHPDQTFFSMVGAHDPLTYGALFDLARRAAGRLLTDYGLLPGETVATHLPNGRAVVTATFCTLFAGLVDTPINAEYSKSLLLFGLSIVEAKAIYTDRNGLEALLDEEVRGYLPSLRVIILCDGEAADLDTGRLPVPVTTLEALTSEGAVSDAWMSLDATSAAIIRFTSGTTGPAKAILQSHLHVLNRTLVHNHIMQYEPGAALYSPFPLHHTLAGVNGLFGTLQVGGSLFSRQRFSASAFWADARDCGASIAHLLRSVEPFVTAQPPSAQDRAHKVKLLWAGAPDDAFEARFGARFIQCFGMSEVGTLAFKRGGVQGSQGNGPIASNMDVQIMDELDRPLPQGAVGQICVRPREPHRLFIGYYNNADATMRALRNLWYHTGDSGHIGEDGELYFNGRMGDTIRRRSVNISSEQIDRELRLSDLVIDCAVIGVPSGPGEEEIHACIIWAAPASGTPADFEAVEALLRARLPKEYVPRFFETVEALPRTPTGKVRKVEIKNRSEFGPTWDRLERRWLHDARASVG